LKKALNNQDSAPHTSSNLPEKVSASDHQNQLPRKKSPQTRRDTAYDTRKPLNQTDPEPNSNPSSVPPTKPALEEKSADRKQSSEVLRDWLMILFGLMLIIFAALNLLDTNLLPLHRDMRITPPVDQAGFAPIFIPKVDASPLTIEDENVTVYPPDRIIIDKIMLDAPVKIAQAINVTLDNQEVTQFLVPEEFAAGWHEGSATLGAAGNTVISGHHNAFGEVFKDLVNLETGDRITLLSGSTEFDYVITNKMILSEKNEPLEVRIENGRWILPSDDERLTLVTCWPKNSNTHRLILVAVPVEDGGQTLQSQLTPTPHGSWVETTPALSDFSESELIPTTGNRPSTFSVINTGRFSVNVRELPDMKGEIIASLKSGHSAVGLGRTALGDWILIKTDEASGWVSAELVEIRVPVDVLPTTLPTITAP